MRKTEGEKGKRRKKDSMMYDVRVQAGAVTGSPSRPILRWPSTRVTRIVDSRPTYIVINCPPRCASSTVASASRPSHFFQRFDLFNFHSIYQISASICNDLFSIFDAEGPTQRLHPSLFPQVHCPRLRWNYINRYSRKHPRWMTILNPGEK